MKFLNMYDISIAHLRTPRAIERTLLVLADSEEAARKLVPSDQRVLRIRCSAEKASSAGTCRIIGFRARSLADAARRPLAADHPLAAPHPTD